ncbi:hypothetical protein GCM10023232_08820 [Sphingosinicella ginsenosidimutans]|uniref:Fido domain-containing protein n=1 Tax=Allosphingosinicella ginsenosidimutans TaxID=1176539 RepID=A0A5C6TXT8_9SPHN|nr:Fic family protein [Sphingosinicella ginsenosidimutans]TXC64691.1 hypothetical protein FRZ32_14160 [Sphingosinicella ginsenosidimutans]
MSARWPPARRAPQAKRAVNADAQGVFQAPRDRSVSLTEWISYPSTAPLSPLIVSAKALELSASEALASSAASLQQLADRLSSALSDPRDYPGLVDELAPFFDDRDAPEPRTLFPKTREEFAAYARMVNRLPPLAGTSETEFAELLARVHARLGEGANGFRTSPISMMIRSDAGGDKIAFPHHRHCRPLVARLHRFLADHIATHPGLCATVAYGAIMHAHPFTDGNGRTGRTMFNLVLAAGTGTRHFVPIHLIAALQRGSFIIKLRRALYGGDWGGPQAFFRDAARLSATLQRISSAEQVLAQDADAGLG